MSNPQKKMPSTLERYELKFVIPDELVDPICAFITPYCVMDKYSTIEEDSYYVINSLYFDTPSLLFYRNRQEGKLSRFNIRIRSYGAHPDFPYFLEVKQKQNGIIRKSRAALNQNEWEHFLTDPYYYFEDVVEKKRQKNAVFFKHLIELYNAEPQVFIQYKRKAYFSIYDDYARVTFDRELKYNQPSGMSPIPDLSRLINCDCSVNMGIRGNIILELKCYTTQVPLWMVDCIRAFNLQRRSFSKYGTGLREVMHFYKPFNALIEVPELQFNPDWEMKI